VLLSFPLTHNTTPLHLLSVCESCAPQDGLSLLHRAVRSGSPDLVRGVLTWAAQHSYSWPIASGGPGGVTPLHLSALLDDDGVIALMLLDACEVLNAFTETRTGDGVSPFHLAFQMGHWGLDRVLAGLGLTPVVTSVVEQQLQPTGWQLLKEATVTDGSDAAAAAAAAAAKKPVKERHTSCLDACLYCQSTLPPLLLSIKAKCAGCGEKQPCIASGEQPGTPPTAAAAAAAAAAVAASKPAWKQQKQGQVKTVGVKRTAAGVVTAGSSKAAADKAVAAAAAAAAPPPGCAHVTGKVLSVTALCQTCHANRVLEVA